VLARSPYHIREWFKRVYTTGVIGQLERWSRPQPVETSLALAACIELGENLKVVNGKRIAATASG
jgi:hypothetical protein